jgi:hypothetical protein
MRLMRLIAILPMLARRKDFRGSEKKLDWRMGLECTMAGDGWWFGAEGMCRHGFEIVAGVD